MTLRFQQFRRACLLAAIVCVSMADVGGLRGDNVAVEPPVLGADEAAVRIGQLRAAIARADELYHRQAQPEIGDYEYDRLKLELAALERNFPEAAAKLGPAPAAVGDDRGEGFQRHRHRERMLSLEKTYSEADLRAFYERVAKALGQRQPKFVVEPKFDGMAISATYEHGKLVGVATRGNGAEGDDVTANARAIRGLPHELEADGGPVPDLVEIRGEVYLSFAEFRRLSGEREESGGGEFASPRNLAAGTLKSLDPRAVARRSLSVVFYGLGAVEPAAAVPGGQVALLARLRAWGLPTVEEFREAETFEAVWAAVQELGRARAGLPFPTDGVVVKLDAAAGQRELGATEEAPRWAIAYKFVPERASTRLTAITLQVGRTGVVTPVAELAPVKLGGATIRRATLHNAAEIARRDIRVGDFVTVERTGEVIPAIVGAEAARREAGNVPFVFPARCPACEGPLSRRNGEVAWRCTANACPGQVKRRVRHFASKEGVGIRGLGEATVDTLVDRGLVRGVADLYRLSPEALAAAGLGGKSAAGLVEAIAASKRAELARFVGGLGIPGVGASSAKALARRFGSLAALARATAEELGGVEGLGTEAATAIARFFSESGGRELVAELVALGVQPSAATTAGELAGKLFVLTGTLPNLSRSGAAELIEAAGGRVAASVSRKTDYLVAGRDPGVKLERAKALGVAVIDEAGLRRLVDESEVD